MKTRWSQLILGTITMLFLGLIYAWSIFREPLMESFFMWSMAEISMTFTISMIMFCLGIILSGKLIEIMKPRWILLLAGIILCVGFSTVSLTLKLDDPQGSLMKLYIFYGGLCGLGVGSGYIAILNAVGSWFPDKPGFAGGILMMGFGFGGLILGSVADAMIDYLGLSWTLLYLGIAIVIVCGLVSFVLRPPTAEETAALPAGKAGGMMTENASTPGQMLRTSYFWLFFIFGIFCAAAGLMVINSAVPIAAYFGASATVGLMVSIFNGGGRVLLGMIFDKFGAGVSLVTNSLILIIGGVLLILTTITKNGSLLWFGLPIIGVAYGGFPALASAIARTRWGKKHYSVNFGIISANLIAAAFLGPYVSGWLQDLSGNFDTTFFMITAFGVVALLIAISLKRQSGKNTGGIAAQPRQDA